MKNIYGNGKYLVSNPDWHTADSPWKAKQIIKILSKNHLNPSTVCDVGCGAGEIIYQLYERLPSNTVFHGYEISPQAFKMCQTRKKDRIFFFLKDLLKEYNVFFDLVLAIDVFEHIEDYFSFLRKLKNIGKYKIFHIPLDISVQSVVRKRAIMNWRETYGHIHYFTKDIALAALKDTGYEIIDYCYAPGSIELPNRNFKSSLLEIPRRLLFSLNKDFTVRLLGGFSLMVLAK